MNQTVLLGEIHPLTAAQREIWLDQAVHGENAPIYKIGGYTQIAGAVDPVRFEHAVNLLVQKHDALRIVLVPGNDEDGMPHQAIAKTLSVQVPLRDFSTADDPAAAALAWALQQLATPFPLDGEPLFRFELLKLNDTRFYFTLNFHHLIVDGWAIGMLVDSLGKLYSALEANEEPALDAPSYIEFIDQDRAFRDSPQFERQRAYWLDKYRSVPDPLFAPRYRERFGTSIAPSGHHALCLSRMFYERIVALAQGCGSTPFHVMLGLLYVYFSRTAQRKDIAIGLPILNRSNARMKSTAGMFAGVSAVRLQFDSTLRFDELLRSLGQVLKQDYRHQRFPVSELNRALGLWQSQRAQVFDMTVSYERDDYDLGFGDGVAQINMCSNGHEQLPLALHIRENRFDEKVWVHFMYNRAYFEHDEVAAISQRFEHLLKQVLDDVAIPVARLALPTPAEAAQLMQWNANGATYERDEPIHRLFEARVEEAPDAIAVEYEGQRLTYAGLNARANRLAHRLIAHGVKPDDRVAICVERGLDMIVGLLGILKAGAGYVPLDPAYPVERLAYTLRDSAPLAVLVQADTRSVLGELSMPVIELGAGTSTDQPTHNPVVAGLSARHLAYVIYTSGSTGQPKGVMIEHRNVTRLFAATDAWFGFGAKDVWALFHSFAFDFSVWEIWGALLHGGRLVVVPKLMSRSPHECYALLCETGVTVLNQTPGAFRQLIAAQAESGDAHRFRHVIFGGEALEVGMLRPWYEDPRNQDTQLVNMYGITETTVHVTYWPLNGPVGTPLCIGQPIPDLSAYVVDEHLNPMPVGVPGELCIGGAGLARGYLNQPELTAKRFIENPFSAQHDARLYRTGDLARFLPDGKLEYLGRIDSQVKIRGFRIELGEIEAALSTLPSVRQALVLAREDEPGERRLVAYLVFDRDQAEPDGTELRAALARTLPDFMLPAQFVPMECLPLTANGKVDQKALPRPAQSVNQQHYVAPRNTIEERLAAIWAQVLRLDRVGVHDNFFASGGDSIRAVSVLSKAKEQGLEFALVDLFAHPTIADLAQALSLDEIAVAPQASLLQISPADKARLPEGIEEAYPLTSLQTGMVYHNQQAAEDAALYHDVFSYRFSVPEWNEAKLRIVLDALARKHPVLRTSFDFQRFDEPLQLVHADGHVPLTVIDLSMHGDAEQERLLVEFVEAERKTAFTLDVAPLLRVFIHLRGTGDIQYTLSFHHAILDGWSVASLNTELFQTYLTLLTGEQTSVTLAPLARSPRVAVESERSALVSQEHRDFWRDYLEGHSFSALPPNDAQTSHAVTRPNLRVAIEEKVRTRLRDVANTLGVPMRSVLLSAHLRVLSMLSGKTDVTTGLVSNVRQEQADGEKVLGLFLNTLPLRQVLEPVSWAGLIQQTFKSELAVIQYRHYPYFQLQLDNDRAPLYEVAFNYINFHVYEALEKDAGFAAHGGSGFEATNFALSVNFADTSSELLLEIKLDTARLSAAQGTRILGYYAAVLDAIAADEQADCSAGDFLSEAERNQVLLAWNDTDVSYSQDACIHELFEAQVASQPDAVALVVEQQHLSYQELNERANRLARHLRILGIGPDTRVAICVERSVEMMVALLAVLKAGGAYVPLDADYPEDRLSFMLEDAAPAAVLTQRAVHERLGALLDAQVGVPVLELDGPDRPWEQQPTHNLPAAQTGLNRQHLAYVIYTSGSTGRPKGVMNEHGAVLNRLQWMQQTYGLATDDVVLQKTPFSFDVSVWEFFWPLLAGARLVMASPQGHKDPAYLKSLIQVQRITTLHFVPSMLEVFLAQGDAGQCDSLRRVFCSGEALPVALIRRFKTQLHTTPLLNLYGPTEAAVDVTAWECDEHAPVSSIGKPIANTQIYLLDGAGQPVPIGVPGELHIAGVQVARGYLNRPELTAERFVDDPFSDVPGARMYKTGDLARYLPDGNIEYLGRNDDQVKIRGFRIELGEIEARLAQHAGVGEAVVMAREDGTGERRLVAYYTLTPAPSAARESVNAEQLRAHLAETLPEYMVPAAYVHLEHLPLTPNGKLNRKALPAPDSDAYVRREYEAPRAGTEQTIAAIWSQVLKVERIGRHDNFFELGGHSLLMVSLIERMRAAGLRADIRVLFSAPTLSELAAYADAHADGDTGAGAAAVEVEIPPNLIPQGTRHITPALLNLVTLKQHEIDTIVATVPGGAANVQDIYPLAALQEGILYHHRSTLRGDPYVLHGLFGFASRAHLDGFARALQRVIARHDILRTAIVWEGLDEPVQVVWREASLGLDELALNPDDGDIAQQLQQRFDTRETRLDVRQAPLMRLSYAHDPKHDRWVAMLRFHHMALDHAALGVVQQEVEAYLQDDAAPLPEPMPYRTYIAQATRGTKREAQTAFFREMLQTIDEPTLPFGRSEVRDDGDHITERSEALSTELARRLRAQARQLGVSAASLCHLAWGRVLSVVSGREEVVFGTVLLGRFQGTSGTDRALGLFINTLPLRVSVGAMSVRAAVKETGARLAALLEHEHASLALAQRCSGVAAPAPLFSALLNYRHGDGHESLVAGKQTWQGIEMLEAHERTNYPLVLSVDDFGVGFGLTVQAASGIDAQRVGGHMRTALESLVDALENAPQTEIRALRVLPLDERQQVLDTFNAAQTSWPQDRTVHALFEAQAAQNPQAIAVTYEAQSLTYGELNTRANRVAHHLIDLGVRPDDRVAICVERSLEMVVGLLGILKAGAGYVPLDPGYPAERLAYMLADSAPVAVLVHARTGGVLETADVPQIDLDDVRWCMSTTSTTPDASNPVVAGLDAHHLAYVIYTSGSTGQPKGVMVEHRNVARLFPATAAWFHFGPDDVWALFHSFAFDFSVWEIWGALLHGGQLCVVPYLTSRSPQACYALLCDAGVTVLNQTPSAFRQLIAAQGESDRQHRLRQVIFGGEALEPAMLKPWFERADNARTQLVNMYGITETTVHVTYRALDAHDAGDRERRDASSVGRCIPDLRIYVLDAERQPVPIGVAGELYVGGAGLARGYLNRPELTAQRFVKDPFSSAKDARIYRTGDVGRWLADGNIEYLGRNDDQVKIRGFRIELGEIEARLLERDGVGEAVVIAREDTPGDRRLVAYYTGEAQPADTLRAHLLASLPAFMIPAAYVPVQALPLTPNGKLDRKALPAPGGDAYTRGEYEAPQGEIESTLAAIWMQLLKVERVSRHDNFFELGGHSLLMISLIERMRQVGLHTDIRALFTAPTLAELAAQVNHEQHEVQVPPNLIPADAERITSSMLNLVTLDQHEIDAIVATVPGGGANVQDIYPLAPLQEGMLYHHLIEQERDPYVLNGVLEFKTRVRLERFLTALQQVIDRHDILRTGFVWRGLEQPLQIVHRRATLPVAFIEAVDGRRETELSSGDVHVDSERTAQYRMDVSRPPLLNCSVTQDETGQRWLLHIVFHHLAVDHTTLDLMLAEAAAIEQGSGDQLPAPVPFRHFIARTRLGTSEREHEAFFQRMLGDIDESTAPFGVIDVTGDGADVGEAHRTLPSDLANTIRKGARARGVTPASLMHLAWALVLAKTTGRHSVVFGTVLFGRMQGGSESDRALGLFINTLPVRIDVDDECAEDSLKQAHNLLLQLLRHEHAPLALAQRCSAVPTRTPLFTSLLNYRYSAVAGQGADVARPGLDMKFVSGTERTNYPLTMAVDDLGEDFALTVQAVPGIDAERVCGYMHTALESLSAALTSGSPSAVRDLTVLPQQEQQQLLSEWNATDVDYPRDQTLHRVIERQAQSSPDAQAVVIGEQSLTYGELNAQANRVAHYLLKLGIRPDDRVAICMERSTAMVAGLLGILKAGAGYVPLDPQYPAERLTFVLADSMPAAVLVETNTRAAIGKTTIPAIDITADDIAGLPSDDPAPAPGEGPENLAYVIYTSGSTGQPKGVMVEHRSLLNHIYWQSSTFGFTREDSILQRTSISFDASAWEIWTPLAIGARLVLLPADASKDIDRIVATMRHHRVTVAQFVPSLLRMLMQREDLRVACRYIFSGGEPLDGPLAQYIRTMTTQGLVNLYGPTETTIDATAWHCVPSAASDTIPIGRPVANTRVYVLDDRLQPVPLGVSGELYIGGAQVARGYLNRPELTRERFIADPFVSGGRLYKTGDLGKWRADGAIEYLGRNDFQVKVRGFRIEPGEIEARLSRVAGVREAVVVVREDTPGDQRLVAYYTGKSVDIEAVRASLRESLPDYMVPAAYVALERMPITLNGKLDRKALPAPDLASFGRRAYEAPQGDTEQALAQVWSLLLNIERVGRHDNFFELGGHSLLAVRVIGRLRQRFGEGATLRALFDTQSLAELAVLLDSREPTTRSSPVRLPIERQERSATLPLSYAQERLWLIQQRDGGRAYNMNGTLVLDGTLSLPALQQAFDSLVARHEPLRTRFDFAVDADVPSQFIDAPHVVDIELIDVTLGDLTTALDAHATAEFDLQHGPLLHVRLLRLTPQQHVVSIVMHHIVSDGWSLGIFVRDLRALYVAHLHGHDVTTALAPLAIQYADHAHWQRQQDLQEHVAYWTNALDGYREPVDLAVPGTPSGAGHGPLGIVRKRLPDSLAAALGHLSQQRGTSLFTIFLVALNVLCHRQSGRDDLCIGTTTAGRDDPLLEPLIGFFVNILPLRMNLAGNPGAADLLDQARQVLLDALDHQALPFEQMIAAQPALRQADGRSPVPVMLRHQTIPPIDMAGWGEGLTVDLWPESITRPAQSDLDLEIFGDAHGLEIVANFDSARFGMQQIDLMLDVMQEILTRLVDEPEARLTTFLEPTAVERALIARVNDTDRAFEATTLAELFARQRMRQPDALACRFENETATYAELDQRSDRIAHALRHRGIEPGMRIALYHPRSIDFLSAILAAFKLGCPYVPVDPAYPVAYVRRTLDDAQPAVVVSASGLAASLIETGLAVLRLDLDLDLEAEAPTPFDPVQARPEDLAYIAYTSGSTGQPKGVLVEHRQVLNCLHALWVRTPFAADEVVGQKTSMSFVPSIKEMLSGLLAGVPQVIFADHVVKDAPLFAAALREHQITRLNLVPSHLAVLLDHAADLGSLRHVTTAGEPLHRRVSERFAELLPHARLHNNYGCSELNDISYCEGAGLDGRHAVVAAGRPIANCRVHVLDDALQPVPVGTVGYLFIEGASVGPGYWNRPDLTAERFVQHPSGARLLRTGDIGQWLPDGQLLHLGREDFQIKVRGQRVELPAVELVLTAHPDIARAAAVGRNAGSETVQLIAFYVATPGAQPDRNAIHAWLSERLPGHMVPSRFVALDALPVLPNGKLDRLALAARELGADAVDTATWEAPQGALETAIAQIWSHALGMDRVGRHDNFFALGGHSLMASQVAVRVSEKLGVKLTVRSIFDTRSVHKLARLVESALHPASSRDVRKSEPTAEFAAFNPSGTQRPLFLTHTLQGYSWYFEHLAAHIDSSIPVYGLPPLPLDMPQPRTLEAIAARFVRIIKSIQPVGPYRIAGWSFGGLIAYEMATQLIAQHDEIEFLGVFDTTLPCHTPDVDAHYASLITLYSFVANNFEDFDPQSLDIEGAKDLDALIDRIVQQIERRKREGNPLWHLAYESAEENRLFLERLVAHGNAMSAWRPTPLAQKLHIFSAQDAAITPLEGYAELPPDLGWQAVLDPSNIVFVPVPGNHETIVKIHADVLGKVISDTLNTSNMEVPVADGI
ncbi:amino acid adenylation domain-containing protein [Paraburkholderia acidicola]|uniref:Amino acid adenylation domain-containing protein n=1 Tax=Paraburkholderia acidicola TaxID=1912599 RepID=A0ABV1LU43_9BURK